ncbi:MAG: Fe-S-containing hydro-lyase [Deferribacteraceae bacterium]|jgi:fumarate hydratase subunit beta|nr:Fe-S-containing hydro-lyase [Deferribacteraceae bacterium]
MAERINLTAPLTDDVIKTLKAGDMVFISGTIYTGRDSAHKKMVELLEKGEPMPFDFTGQVIYYAGPCPAKPGRPIGSVGPTTSLRMDAYSPKLIRKGLKSMIGKGFRNKEVMDAMVECGGVYFAAIGGAAALMAKCVQTAEVIAFEEFGTEAVRKLTVKDLPVVVAIDSKGNDMYKIGMEKFAKN